MRSVTGTFLHIKSLDQDQTGLSSRNQSKELKEFSLIIKSKKLCQETKDCETL